MPIWQGETVEPFDEDEELKASIPKDLADFFAQNEVAKIFKITLKRFRTESYMGRPDTLGEFEGIVPTYLAIVGLEGPGYFSMDCEWHDKASKRQSKQIRIPLVGEYWTQVWEEAKAAKDEKKIKDAEFNKKLDIAKSGGNLPAAIDPMKIGRGYVEDLKALGGMGGNQNDSTMTLFMGMMQMMMKQSENTTQLLIAMMQGNNSKNSTQDTLALVGSILDIKEKVAPRDRNVIETFVEALADNADDILALFNKNPVEQAFDPAFQGVKNAAKPLADKAKVDPAFLKALVQHMDAKVGPDMTDKVLAGYINVKRPAGTKPAPAPAPSPEPAPKAA